MKILIVDDQPANLLALEGLLAAPGQEVVQAVSGEDALKRLLRDDYAVILLDVQMPGLDGFETARLIRERARSRHTPIIFLTAYDKTDVHVLRGYSLGAVDYLFKPFAPEMLRAKVATFVALARQTTLLWEEVRQRHAAEEEVRQLNESLETRVRSRTEELERANWELQGEIARRRRIEEVLQQREEQLRAQAEALSAADRRKDEWLATLSHELRNPLAAVRMALEVLRSNTGPAHPRALETIDRQVRHQVRLLEDLLDVTRIHRGKMQLNRETLDLTQLTRDALEDCRVTLEGAGLRAVPDLPVESVAVLGDATRLAQVISNLLVNAAKFTDQGGKVTVALRVLRETHEAELRVRDTGTGIAPEALPNIFTAFSQSDLTVNRSRGGLGLGLALVRGIVLLHGGTVDAQSDGVGQGSEFIVRLPLAPACPPIDRDAELPTKASGALRILLVEDNRDAAETLRDLLELYGHTLLWVDTGADAVTAAPGFLPDIVLCDIGLPIMDGFAVARALRADPTTTHVRLIAVSGYGQAEDRRRSREAGFDYHLVKPVDPDELCRLLVAPAH